jgi:hypothetical protein
LYRSDKGEFMLGTTTSFSRPFAAPDRRHQSRCGR